MSPALRQRVVRLVLELCDAIEEESVRKGDDERAAPRPAVTRATDTQRAFAKRVLAEGGRKRARS